MIDGAAGIARGPVDVELVAGCRAAGKIRDLRRRVVDQERIADQGSAQRVIGRVAGRIGGGYAKDVFAVGKRSGVPTEGPFLDVVLKKLPRGLLHAADFHAIDQGVVVFVRRQPARAFKAFRISHAQGGGANLDGRGGIASLLANRRKGDRVGWRNREDRLREAVIRRSDIDSLHHGRNVFGKVGDLDVGNLGRGLGGGGCQIDLVLQEPGRR